jgi:hypothetical protein
MNDHSAVALRNVDLPTATLRGARARAVYHLAKADFLERLRRISFLVTLAATSYFGYLAWAGRIHLSSHDYTGIANSAWTGTLMAIVASTFLSLCGFYVVRQTVERDRMTRVGPILATTPASSFEYLFGKFLSNLAVLSAMLGVLAIAAIALQLLRHESGHFDIVSLVLPFLLLALPAMALVAAMAVLFDVTPGLSGGLGNVIYFFVWIFGLAGSIEIWKKFGALTFTDPVGLGALERQLEAAALAAGADPKANDFALNIGGSIAQGLTPFLWNGLNYNASLVFGRLFWIGVAVGTVLASSLFFHRFDPAYESSRKTKRGRDEQTADEHLLSASPATSQIAWRDLSPVRRGTSFLPLLAAELRLAIRGQAWWWKLGALAIIIAGLASPNHSVPLAFAAVWPVLILSQFGCREPRFDTTTLIYNSPINGAAHILSAWIAGTLVMLAMSSGAIARMLIAHDARVLSVFIGAAFISALAVSAGTLSGGPKLFEAVYIALWYMGPLNAAPGMDFMGATPAAAPAHFAAYAAILLATAVFGRRVRQARVA